MLRWMKTGLPAFFLLAFVVLQGPVEADQPTILETLKQPGVHAIMRHALAPGTGDPENFSLDDCTTQRNLDESGRAQAREIGTRLRDAGIDFDRVLTSQWCRCRETARSLGLGAVEDLPALNSFFRDRSTAGAQTEELRSFLAALPDDERIMLVTHQVNITALTDQVPSSGEILLIRVNDAAEVEVVGEYLVQP